jgi:hypothetical protein
MATFNGGTVEDAIVKRKGHRRCWTVGLWLDSFISCLIELTDQIDFAKEIDPLIPLGGTLDGRKRCGCGEIR